MNLLLDTHTLIWSMLDSNQLSKRVIEVLENPINQVLVSTISLWEISLKYSLGKLELDGVTPDQFPELIEKTGFSILAITAGIASSAHHLGRHPDHKDPFDRMLIWQGIQENLVVVTKDKQFDWYSKYGLKILW